MKLIFLSQKFYEDYSGCSEILKKQNRPYMCLGIRINGLLFAIPFRHHIGHKYAFFIDEESGLDYTKAVIITKREYIDNKTPWINQKSFNAIKGKEAIITREFSNFIKIYKKAVRFENNPHYQYIRKCSALSHFSDLI